MVSLQQLVDNHISHAITQKEKERTSSNKFNVSSAGRCHLMRYWDRQKKEGKLQPDARTLRVFEVGKLFENWILSLLVLQPKLMVSIQGLVEDEHKKGYYDLLIKNADEKIFLYDIKTVHSRKFWHNEKEGWNKDIHYHHQVATYHFMTKDIEIDECRLCYISKDDLCIREIPVYPEKIREDVENDWRMLIDSWVNGIEPKPNPSAWECKRCGYNQICEYGKEQLKCQTKLKK